MIRRTFVWVAGQALRIDLPYAELGVHSCDPPAKHNKAREYMATVIERQNAPEYTSGMP